MAKTLIAIVSYNAKRYMQECIQSIRDKLTPGSYCISVVDNASTDGICQWLEAQDDILLTKNTNNVGFGPACNQAVLASVGTDFEDADVFLLNNDTVMTSTALPRMIDALYSSDNIGAVGAMANYAGNRQQLDVSFSSTEEYIAFGESLNAPIEDSRIEKTRLNGFAMLVRRNVWNDIGGFDDDFAPGYYEDDALSIEILKRGYRMILERNSFIYHVGSASFVKTGTNRLSYEHHDLFIKKYGFDILDYVYPCGAVISQIPFERTARFKVLHLGCGLGAELKAIRSLFPNSELYGIENNPVLYQIVSKTEKVFSDVYEALAENGQGFFDLLIIDDYFLEKLSEDDKHAIAGIFGKNAVEINRIHEYDEFPFDDIKLIIWDENHFNQRIADILTNWGIMSSVYANDNFKKRVAAYGLFHKNILLVSDDPGFRANAYFLVPDLPSSETAIIPYLTAHYSRKPITDPEHRCAHDLVLFEQKYSLQKNCESPEAFLRDSNITITINKDCLGKITGIETLLKEAYILDYVRNGLNKSQLAKILANDWNDCAYITAKDNYGDYGIIGFYAINTRESKVLAFAFSWKVAGMGIEQYIYNKLGCPEIITTGPVRPALQEGAETPWINEDIQNSILDEPGKRGKIKILLKGSRTLKPIEDLLIGGIVTTEYDDLSATDQANSPELPTYLFTNPYHIIIYSLLQEDYSAWAKNSDEMLSELFKTLDNLCSQTPGNPMVILLLGSETPFTSGTDDDRNLAELHKELNPIIMEYAEDHPKIRTINVSDLIKDQNDFDGSVNRFGVRVYSDMVEQIVVFINQKVDEIIASSQGRNTGTP